MQMTRSFFSSGASMTGRVGMVLRSLRSKSRHETACNGPSEEKREAGMLRALCVGRRGIAPGARRLFSSTGLDINARTEARLRGAYSAFDPRAVELLARLQCSEAPLVWHKHGTFYEHLRDCLLYTSDAADERIV